MSLIAPHNNCFTSRFWPACFALLILLLTSCGSEHTPLGPNEAMLVVNMPSMKSNARALDTKGSPIPAEVTEILFEVADAAGTRIGGAQDFLKVKSVQFALAADRNYTLTGTAKFGTVTLYQGSETVTALKPGETRDVAVSLLAKIKLALSVTSDVQNPQGGTGDAVVQWKLGQTKKIGFNIEGLDEKTDKTIVWSVNDIPGGDATLGTVSPIGTYTPPAVIPANPNIRIKAVPAAAPSFAKNVDVKLISEPGNSEFPISSANPPGGLFASPQTVTLSCTACSAIHFTVDGSEPTTASSPYSGAIGVGAATVLKFFAVNAIGNAEDTHTERYTFIAPPAAPTNLNATAGDGQIDLAWGPVAGATEYRVFRGTSAGVSVLGEPVGTVATTSFKSLGLFNGTTYFFKVVAANAGGAGGPSVEMSTTPLPPKPSTASNLAATSANTEVSLTWTGVAGATKYHVFRNSNSGVTTLVTPLAIVTTTNYTDSGLTNGANYYYRVVGANLAGLGPDSNEVAAQPLPALPGQPTGLSATAGNTQTLLNWNAVAGASEYRIFRGGAPGVSTDGSPIAIVVGTSHTDSNLINGNTYFYKVLASNIAGPGAASTEVSARPLPALPFPASSLVATAGNTQINLSWTAGLGATEYRIFRGTTAGVVTTGEPLATVSVTTLTDNNLANGTLYFYNVVAVNQAGISAAATEVSAKPLPSLPLGPTNLSATARDAQVALAWAAVSGATEYRIFRSTAAGVSTTGEAIATVNAPSYTDSGLTNGTTYFYRVVATNIAGPGADSAEVNARPLPPLPAAPSNLSTAIGDGQVTLSWTAVAGATGYNVYRGTTPGVSTGGTTIGTVVSPSLTSIGLTNGVIYYFKVVATNIAGPSPDSAEVSGQPFPPIPIAPAGFTATAGDAQASLSWAAVAGATEYRIFRSTTAGVITIGDQFTKVNNTVYVDTGLTNGTTYFYRVVAANIAGPGAASQEVNAKPLPPPLAPTNLTATPGDTQVALAWTPVAGATEYRVYRGTVSGVVSTGPALTTVASASYTNTGLTNGTSYYYKIVAANVVGPSPASLEVNAKPLPPPTAPTNLTATPGNTQVALAWTAVAVATEYRVYRGPAPGVVSTGPALATVATTSYTNTGLTNGTTYYYKVVAANTAGPSLASLEVNAQPLPPPTAPFNLVTKPLDGQIELTWSAVTGATGYRVYRSTTSGVVTAAGEVGTVTTLSFTSMGLTNGVTYYFRVVSTNIVGRSPDSVEVSAIPLPPIPAAPANVTAKPGDAQVALSWDAVAGATEYRLYTSTISGSFGVHTPVNTTSYTSRGLSNGTNYYYKVVAANVAGPGPSSAEIGAMPLPASVTLYANVTGLNPLSAGGAAGSGLVLKNNGGDSLTINSNGLFGFVPNVLMNNPYNVTVATQPTNPAQTCTVAPPASGTITLGNVTVNVTCVTNNYAIGGVVTGLAGSGFVLSNGGKPVVITVGNTFSVTMPSGTAYSFVVTAQPSSPTQFCSVVNANGTVGGANINNVAVSCVTNSYLVGGVLSGLSPGTTLTLNNNGSEPLVLNANGKFNFTSKVLSGGRYNVKVAKQPLGQNCSITNASGIVGSADVSTIAASCIVINIPRYAFVTNRGENTVSSFVIEAATGRMKFVSKTATGNFPTGVAVDPRGQFVYVVNNFSHDLSQYRIQLDGSLAPITGKTVPTGQYPWAITVEPNGKYAYVTNDGEGTVGQYLIGAKGELTEIGNRISTGGISPRSVTADPSGQFLYAVNMNSDDVAQYAIQPDGTLAASAKPISTGDAPQNIVIEASGKFAYVVNNYSHSVSAYTLDAKGMLTRISCATVCAPNDPVSFATGNYPWAVATPATGQYLYVTNDGDGNVSQFTIGDNGQLSVITTPIGTGTSPRSLLVDPSGKFAYAGNFNSDDVSQYTITGKGNLVANSPAVVSAHANPSAMAVAGGSTAVQPVAKSVYVSDDGVSGASVVRQYGIGADGTLSDLGKGSVPALLNPRGVAIDPTGTRAYVANNTPDGGFLMQYPISADGSLGLAKTTPLGKFDALSVVVHPAGRYVYVTHGNPTANVSPNAITQFSIAADGTLASVGVRQGDGVYPAGIAIHPTGKYAYVANFYGDGGKISGSVSQYTIAPKTGSLQPIAGKPYALTGSNPFGVTVDATGRFAYVTNFGVGTISQFNVGSDGSLSNMATPSVPAGSGPTNLVLHPSGQFAYVSNLGNGAITEYSVGTDGSLTLIATIETNEKLPLGLTLDTPGNYLYVTNNGGNTVSQFRVEKTGILTRLVPTSVKTDGAPSGIATLGTYQ